MGYRGNYREFRKCYEITENKITRYHNLWDAAKGTLTGKMLALN